MKKQVFLFALILSVFMWSCGGNTDSEANSDENTEQDGSFTAIDGLITAEMPNDWTKDGKGPNTFSMYSYLMDEGSDMHKDIIHDYGFPAIDKVAEIKVDGLPALTLKEIFSQNKEMIGRTWLIYNGTVVINVTVQSEKANWNDAVAKKMIALVKVTQRETNVQLPGPIEEPRFVRPETYPEEVLARFDEHYTKTSVLTIENIQASINTYKFLKDSAEQHKDFNEEQKKEFVENAVTSNGFKNSEEYIKIILVANTGLELIHSALGLKNIDENSADYKISYDILNSIITQATINKDDIRFIYDNWDISKECIKLHEAK